MEHLASCRHICSPLEAACCAKPQTFERNPKPHPFWCQDRNHPPDKSNDPRSAATTLSSPSSCGVHQCCAMATAWRTASSNNTCEHPSNQEIACLSTERLECATNRKHVWCNIDSRCLKTWILQLFHMCFTFH